MSIIKISDDYEYGSDYIDNMIRYYYNFFKESNSEYFKEEIKKMELEKDKMEVENNSVQLKEKRRRSSKSTSSPEQKRKLKIT